MPRRSFIAAGVLAAAISTAFANDANTPTAVKDSLVDNSLKSFAYDWYARFDSGPEFAGLAPNLPDENVEFIFPQATVNSVTNLKAAFESAWKGTVASAHEIDELYINKTAEPDLFEVLAPHTYLIERTDGSFGEIEIVSRMRVRTNSKTKLDPEGKLPKLEGYRVDFEGVSNGDIRDRIAATRSGALGVNDAKAFVHAWFAAADAKDSQSMLAMTSDGALNIDLLGTKIADKTQLGGYFNAVDGAQKWAAHRVNGIEVTPSDEGFKVRFLVRFEGEVTGRGIVRLSNLTNWLLVEEDGELRLRDYKLSIL